MAAVLADASGIAYTRVRRLLAGWAGYESVRGKIAPLTQAVRLPNGLGPLLPAHERYLRSRGLDPGTCVQLWGLQGIGVAAELGWRVFLPVVLHGKTVSWTTRGIGQDSRRYISARPEDEAVPLKRTLFGWDLVRSAVVVVEGPFDAIRVGPGAVATYGLTVTRKQLQLLASIPTRIICFDTETEAQRTAARLAEQLAPYPGRTVRVELETGKDACASSEREIQQLRKMIGE